MSKPVEVYRTVVIKLDKNNVYQSSASLTASTPFTSWNLAIRWVESQMVDLAEWGHVHLGRIRKEVIPISINEEKGRERFDLIQKTILPAKAAYKSNPVIWKGVSGISEKT